MQPTKTNSNEHESRRNTSSFSSHVSHPNHNISTNNIIRLYNKIHNRNESNYRLYYQIYAIQPALARKITAMLIDSLNQTQIQFLLYHPIDLNNKINEAMAVLKHSQQNQFNRFLQQQQQQLHPATQTQLAFNTISQITVQLQATQAQLHNIVPQLTSLQTQLQTPLQSQNKQRIETQYRAVSTAYEKHYRKYLLYLQQIQQLRQLIAQSQNNNTQQQKLPKYQQQQSIIQHNKMQANDKDDEKLLKSLLDAPKFIPTQHEPLMKQQSAQVEYKFRYNQINTCQNPPSIISSTQSTPALCSVSNPETESLSNSSMNINCSSSVNNQSVITNISSSQQITPITQVITAENDKNKSYPSIQTNEDVTVNINTPPSNISVPKQTTQIEQKTPVMITDELKQSLPNSNNSVLKPQIKSCVNNATSDQITKIEMKTENTEVKMPSFCTIRTVRMIVNAPVPKPILQSVLQQQCIVNPMGVQKIFVRCHKSYYHSNATVVYIHFINFNNPSEYIQCKDKVFNFDYNSTNIIGLIGNKFRMILVEYPIKEYKPTRVPIEYLTKMVNICLRCKWNEAENRKRVCKYCVFEEINDRNKIAEYYNNAKNKAKHKSPVQIEKDLINLKIEPHLIPLPIYKSRCPCLENDNNKGKCTRKNCTYRHDKHQEGFGKKLSEIQYKASKRRYYKLMNQYELDDYEIVAMQFKYRQIIANYYEKQWKYNLKIINNENNINKIKQYLTKCRIKLHLIPSMYKSPCKYKCRISSGKFCHFIHLKNDQIFGDMLFQIKCNAKNNFETQSNASYDEKSELDFTNDIIDKMDEKKCNESPLTCAIKPYMDAVNDEQYAEIKELDLWSISTNISVKIEYNKYNNPQEREYELYFIYEDNKDAKIKPWRTYIDVLFSCEYDVGLRTDASTSQNMNGKTNKKPKQWSKSCPGCYFNVCNENEHWKLENDTMRLIETNKGRFSDKLRGVVVERLKSIHQNKKRYKVKMEKYGPTGFNINWLKFAIVASSKYNFKKHRKNFYNINISYLPSPVHEKIKYVLKRLNNGSLDCTEICKMIFGIGNVRPKLINKYNVSAVVNVTAVLIKKLFPTLNDSQINGICGSLMYNLHTIQGPPATGKTSICAHISYLWWRLNGNNGKVKIHGMVPTNKGSLVLAQKCMDMNKRRMSIVGQNKPEKSFKVLYFASDTYLLANNEFKIDNQNDLMGKICVNVIVENKLRQLKGYKNMNKQERNSKTEQFISNELKSADMIITTFGNAQNKLLQSISFTHAICDEANQGSLDTFLGIIRSDIQQLTMAGDIQQLAPVIKSDNPLAAKSVYEDIISYLTNKTNKTNTYYTRLLTQYRSHPQIYKITSKLFYHNTVKNPKMYAKREYGNLNYGQLFINNKNHIQWHMYEQSKLDIIELNQQSKCNKYEAQIALKYIKKFIIELGNNERDIAVLSDYRAQIDYMEKLLVRVKQINMSEILLCTTNEIEGSSKPIVIYMCVRSNNTGSIGFLKDNKRVNVALSRAEYGQIIIGDINTLQYNPIYNKIFTYHLEQNAVVTENNGYNQWNKNENWITKIDVNVPVINMNQYEFAKLNKRNDYYICSGCGKPQVNKLFCGRSCNKIDFCERCMHNYLWKYCKVADKLAIKSKVIIDKSDFFAADANGISMDFDIILGKYLMDYDLIKHIRENQLTNKLCNVAMNLCNNIKKKYWKYIPNCFQILVEKYYNNEVNLNGRDNTDEVKTALGIMECKRNHLLQQNIMDTRFFHIVNKIRYNNNNLKKYYNYNASNQYTFYLCKEFEEYQPATVIVAYLQCCGYSNHISNRLRTRIAKELSEINKNNEGRYNKHSVQKLDKLKIEKFAQQLCSDQSHGLCNILSNGKIINAVQWNYYVIELMQTAIINDTLGPYYQSLTHDGAMKAEWNFGDKLRAAGFGITTENELKEKGFDDATPDYILNKPWIIQYNDRKVEINWIDFKNQYCSATEWNIEKLNYQAIKYNNKFGVGAFVFSLGFVKPPEGLQLNCYGLLAAVPLSKKNIELFIQKRLK